MSNSVIYMDSTQNGAPAVGETAGSLISLLTTVLTTGYGFVTLDSIVVSDGVATCTRLSGHGFKNIDSKGGLVVLGPVVQISGATPAELNGNHRITVLSTTVFTFDATGIPDGVATGTIVANIPPLGWELVWGAPNTAVFRNTAGTGMYLRFNDDGSLDDGDVATVIGYESMSSIDIGTSRFPPESEDVRGRFIPKYQSSTLNKWIIVGDAKRFYFLNFYYTSRGCIGMFFGDIVSYVPGDAYHFCIGAPPSCSADNAYGYNIPWYHTSTVSSTYGMWFARGWDQYPNTVQYTAKGATLSFTAWGGGDSVMALLANPVDGRSWWCYPNYAIYPVGTPRHIRGHFPGAWRPEMQFNETTIGVREQMLFDNVANGGDAVLLTFAINSNANGSSNYWGAIDVNGPWE